MKDFCGREIKLGDHIVYARTQFKSMAMSKHTVVGFSKGGKMVKIKPKIRGSYAIQEYSLAKPQNCIVYTPVEEVE